MYSLYGGEVVLPMELTYGSPQVQDFEEQQQEKLWHDDVMLLEEDRLGCTMCRLILASHAPLSYA